MKEKNLTAENYLDPNFDYKKLTKTELKKILFENNVTIRTNALKQELLDNYKTYIFDRIEELKNQKQKELQKMDNIYQSGSSIVEIDFNDNNNLLSQERVLRRNSASAKAISNKSHIEETPLISTKSENSSISLNEKLAKIKKRSQMLSKRDLSSFLEDKSSLNNNFDNNKQNLEKTSSKRIRDKKEQSKILNATSEKCNFSQQEDADKTLGVTKRDKQRLLDQNNDNLHYLMKEAKSSGSNIKEEKSFIDYKKDKRILPEKEENVTINQKVKNNIFVHKNEKNQFPKKEQNVSFTYENKSKPMLSNKEQLKLLVEEDMRKNPNRRLSDTSLFNSSFSSYIGTSFSNESTVVQIRRSKKRIIIVILLAIITVCLVLFLKNLPYTNGNCFFCVKIPLNGKIKDNKLVCDKGFILKKSIFGDCCIKDNTKSKIINSILDKLAFKHGNYRYGTSTTPLVNIKELTDNEEVISELKTNPKILWKGDYCSSKIFKISLRTFMHFYIKKILLICLPILLIICLFKYLQYKFRIRKKIELESKKTTKDVLNVLLRQLIISTNNNRFPEYVYIDQLKDVFGESNAVWKIVVDKVKSNSNVSTIKIENKDAWQWIGPIIRRKESIEEMKI